MKPRRAGWLQAPADAFQRSPGYAEKQDGPPTASRKGRTGPGDRSSREHCQGKGHAMRSRSHEVSILRVRPLAVAAVILAGIVGPPARGATLRWKFKPGETLRYVMDQRAVTTATLPGGEQMRTTLSQTIETTWTVKSVDPSGQAEMTQTITRI